MLLNSVLIVLRETLEAAMVISLLLAAGSQRGFRSAWAPWSLAVGTAAAAAYALNMRGISQSFNYAGQELVNAALQISIAVLIVIYIRALFRDRRQPGLEPGGGMQAAGMLYNVCASAIVVTAVTREGAEVAIFVIGFVHQMETLQAVLFGSSIGAGIGISIGILLYYGIMSFGIRTGSRIVVVLLALFAGNMLSQASVQFAQADWISATEPLWNTDNWLPENSIPGQLLYALVGYESTPSLVQAACYLGGLVVVLSVAIVSAYSADKAVARTESGGEG